MESYILVHETRFADSAVTQDDHLEYTNIRDVLIIEEWD